MSGAQASSAAISSVTLGVGTATDTSELEVTGAPPTPPSSFDGAATTAIGNSGVTGCVARIVPGWAEVHCDAKNVEGGVLHGARITSGAPVGTNPDVKPAADGTLTLVLPWLKGHRSVVRFEWANMTQDLTLLPRGTKFSRVLPQAQADQCERFEKSSEQILKGIRAKIGPFSPAITPKDVFRFPELGHCQMAGRSAWALSLEKLTASGDGANREVVVTLALNYIDPTGAVASAPYGPLAFAPEGLQLPELMLYDYDADGEAEVIVRQDVLVRAERSLTKPLPNLAAVYTYKQGKVSPYAALSARASGGIVVEQLEADGRPDVGDYGPFIAWLPEKCGRGECPKRVTGPRFFLRSTADGGFSAQDDHVESLIRKKCERTPKELVVDVRTASGKRQTAQNVACARVRGDATNAIVAQLNELKSEMCDDAQPTCPLYVALTAWAWANPPQSVGLPRLE